MYRAQYCLFQAVFLSAFFCFTILNNVERNVIISVGWCLYWFNKAGVLLMSFDCWVVNIWNSGQECLLVSLILICDNFLLVSVQGKKLAFLLTWESLECTYSCGDLAGKNWHQWVIFVSHNTISNASESWFESSLLNLSSWFIVL